MAGASRRHSYSWDGVRRVAEPIHPRWYTTTGVAELNEKLRAPPVALRLRAIAKELPPKARPRLTSAGVPLVREGMAATDARAAPPPTPPPRHYPRPGTDPRRVPSPPGPPA